MASVDATPTRHGPKLRARKDGAAIALDDLDKLQHGQAWARTGAVFGTDEQKQTIAVQLEELGNRIGIVHLHLEIHDQRASTTEQPAADRWSGLAVVPTDVVVSVA